MTELLLNAIVLFGALFIVVVIGTIVVMSIWKIINE